jgi:hypothetical protein
MKPEPYVNLMDEYDKNKKNNSIKNLIDLIWIILYKVIEREVYKTLIIDYTRKIIDIEKFIVKVDFNKNIYSILDCDFWKE